MKTIVPREIESLASLSLHRINSLIIEKYIKTLRVLENEVIESEIVLCHMIEEKFKNSKENIHFAYSDVDSLCLQSVAVINNLFYEANIQSKQYKDGTSKKPTLQKLTCAHDSNNQNVLVARKPKDDNVSVDRGFKKKIIAKFCRNLAFESLTQICLNFFNKISFVSANEDSGVFSEFSDTSVNAFFEKVDNFDSEEIEDGILSKIIFSSDEELPRIEERPSSIRNLQNYGSGIVVPKDPLSEVLDLSFESDILSDSYVEESKVKSLAIDGEQFSEPFAEYNFENSCDNIDATPEFDKDFVIDIQDYLKVEIDESDFDGIINAQQQRSDGSIFDFNSDEINAQSSQPCIYTHLHSSVENNNNTELASYESLAITTDKYVIVNEDREKIDKQRKTPKSSESISYHPRRRSQRSDFGTETEWLSYKKRFSENPIVILKKTSSLSDSGAIKQRERRTYTKDFQKATKPRWVKLPEPALSTKTSLNFEITRKRRIKKRNFKLQKMFNLVDSQPIIYNEKLLLDYSFDDARALVTVDPALTKCLKSHQREGVKFIWDCCYESIKYINEDIKPGGCILAHSMGLGKSLQIISLLHTLLTNPLTKTRTALIVCPTSTILNWVEEFEKWLKDVPTKINIFTFYKIGSKYHVQQLNDWHNKGGILIIGYSTCTVLYRWSRETVGVRAIINKCLFNPGPDVLICDEGHVLKNNITQVSEALHRISTVRKIVLTGTPIQNNLKEFYSLVNFVKPNIFGPYESFHHEFETKIVNGQHKDSKPEEIDNMKIASDLLHKLVDGCIHRAEENLLTMYLPPKTEYVIMVTLTKAQSQLYTFYLMNFCLNDLGKMLLSNYSQLGKIWNHPRMLSTNQNTKNAPLLPYQDVDWWTPIIGSTDELNLSNKFHIIFQLLDECARTNEKMLIFSLSLQALSELEYFLIKLRNWRLGNEYFYMHGGVNDTDRHTACKLFNDPNNQKARVFLITTRTGSLGLNLTGANRVVLLDVSWNPADDTQCAHRVFRFGQTRPTFVYRLVTAGTMEEHIYRRSITKESISGRVLDVKQIARHFREKELVEIYKFTDTSEYEGNNPIDMSSCNDAVLRSVYQRATSKILSIYQHDELLRHQSNEELNDHEKRLVQDRLMQYIDMSGASKQCPVTKQERTEIQKNTNSKENPTLIPQPLPCQTQNSTMKQNLNFRTSEPITEKQLQVPESTRSLTNNYPSNFDSGVACNRPITNFGIQYPPECDRNLPHSATGSQQYPNTNSNEFNIDRPQTNFQQYSYSMPPGPTHRFNAPNYCRSNVITSAPIYRQPPPDYNYIPGTPYIHLSTIPQPPSYHQHNQISSTPRNQGMPLLRSRLFQHPTSPTQSTNNFIPRSYSTQYPPLYKNNAPRATPIHYRMFYDNYFVQALSEKCMEYCIENGKQFSLDIFYAIVDNALSCKTHLQSGVLYEVAVKCFGIPYLSACWEKIVRFDQKQSVAAVQPSPDSTATVDVSKGFYKFENSDDMSTTNEAPVDMSTPNTTDLLITDTPTSKTCTFNKKVLIDNSSDYEDDIITLDNDTENDGEISNDIKVKNDEKDIKIKDDTNKNEVKNYAQDIKVKNDAKDTDVNGDLVSSVSNQEADVNKWHEITEFNLLQERSIQNNVLSDESEISDDDSSSGSDWFENIRKKQKSSERSGKKGSRKRRKKRYFKEKKTVMNSKTHCQTEKFNASSLSEPKSKQTNLSEVQNKVETDVSNLKEKTVGDESWALHPKFIVTDDFKDLLKSAVKKDSRYTLLTDDLIEKFCSLMVSKMKSKNAPIRSGEAYELIKKEYPADFLKGLWRIYEEESDEEKKDLCDSSSSVKMNNQDVTESRLIDKNSLEVLEKYLAKLRTYRSKKNSIKEKSCKEAISTIFEFNKTLMRDVIDLSLIEVCDADLTWISQKYGIKTTKEVSLRNESILSKQGSNKEKYVQNKKQYKITKELRVLIPKIDEKEIRHLKNIPSGVCNRSQSCSQRNPKLNKDTYTKNSIVLEESLIEDDIIINFDELSNKGEDDTGLKRKLNDKGTASEAKKPCHNDITNDSNETLSSSICLDDDDDVHTVIISDSDDDLDSPL